MALQDSSRRIRRLTLDAISLALAMVFSYLESLLPVFIPLPGVKLGLTNLVIMLLFFHVGRADALIISLFRVFLTGLFFGSASSFFFSLGGAVLAYTALLLLSLLGEGVSRIGISVGSAAAHGVGQILAAALLYGSPGLFSYLPFLLLGSLPFGILLGILLILVERALPEEVAR